MKLVVASTSPTKINACRAVFAGCTLEAMDIPSGVPAQPVDDEAQLGALNRMAAMRAARPGADIYVAIENGLFLEDGQIIDRAVVALARGTDPGVVIRSEGVAFPKDAFDIAKARGFDTCTVGQVMAEMGLVKNHFDPHLDVSGKSREIYITEALSKAAWCMGLRPQAS